MIRTYALKHSINIGKQKKIVAVLKAYRQLAVKVSALQWQEFYQQGYVDKNLNLKKVETPLSERYKQTCQYQVVGVLKSFIANRQNEFVKLVWCTNLNDEIKRDLFYINKYHLWYTPGASMPAFDDEGKKIADQVVEIPQETMRLARAIFKQIMKRHRKPRLMRCNLAMDHKVAKISPRQDSDEKAARQFDYWIQFSTLESGRPIYLPLSTHSHFEDKVGKLKKFCQINLGEQDRLTVCLIKDVKKRAYLPQTPKISLDFGLRNLFAVNSGDLFGRDFIEVLKRYDSYISSLAANRQRQKLNVKSRAYNALVRQLRNYLKNEINRVINRIIEVYQPKEIAVEKLNFTSPQLSRRLNRLLSNMGRRIINQKFDSISEEFAIVITEVPAPYTSQQCNNCDYVDRSNRISQSIFYCRHCHKKLHADVNGSRNIFDRSSSKELSNVYLSKQAILDILIRDFTQRYPDIYVYASELLESNPYFQRDRQYGNNGNLEYG